MNGVLGFLLAVLVYPGVVVALLAAVVLAWVRDVARGALTGAALSNPLQSVAEMRTTFDREATVPEGIQPGVIAATTIAAVIFPLLALVLLPVPGNPLVKSLGLTGDLALEAALLLALPATRLLLGWVLPSPYTQLAADRGVRMLAGAALPMALAIAANLQQFSSLALTPLPGANGNTLNLVAFILAAVAFAMVVPALARFTPLRQPEGELDAMAGELSELSGRDLAFFRTGEALQLVATAGFFVAAFIVPIFSGARGAGLALVWIGGILLAAILAGAADAFRSRSLTQRQESPLDWWSGLPLLLALAALVASAWATRGT